MTNKIDYVFNGHNLKCFRPSPNRLWMKQQRKSKILDWNSWLCFGKPCIRAGAGEITASSRYTQIYRWQGSLTSWPMIYTTTWDPGKTLHLFQPHWEISGHPIPWSCDFLDFFYHSTELHRTTFLLLSFEPCSLLVFASTLAAIALLFLLSPPCPAFSRVPHLLFRFQLSLQVSQKNIKKFICDYIKILSIIAWGNL